ncbi:MAG: ATP-binding protein [Desulfovibrionaceae bacterium]
MDNLITPRLDYIQFIHGLCLFFVAGLAGYCLKTQRRMRWLWLTLFALAQGLSIAFVLVQQTAPDLLLLKSISVSFLALSLFFLALFGLHSLWSGRLRGAAYVMATVFMVLPAASAILYGLDGFEATARVGLGPLAGVLAVFGLMGPGREEAEESFLPSFQPLLGLYVVCLTIIPALHLLLRAVLLSPASLLEPLPQELYVVVFAGTAMAFTASFARSMAFEGRAAREEEGAGPARQGAPSGARGATVAYAYGIAAVGLAVFLGFSITEIMGHSAEQSMRTELFMRVSAVGNALHADEVKALNGVPDDLNNPSYRRLMRQLTKIRIANPDLRFVYLVNLRLPERNVIFLLDTEPPSSEDYVLPGEIYDEAPPELVTLFSSGKARLVGPYEDRWGYWISGLAPVKADDGAITAVVGMDISARNFIANVAAARLTGILISFLLAVIGASVGLIVQRNQLLAAANAALLDEVAQRVRAEERLTRAKRAAEEANQAKSDFLARMSHEIRTPMTIMLGVGDLLREAELAPEQAELVELFSVTGEGLLTLINDILDLSKVEAGKIVFTEADFDLQALVERTVAVMNLTVWEKDVQLLWDIDSTVPRWLKGDEMHLRQVLVNLMGNAAKFTHEGRIELSVCLADVQPAADRAAGRTTLRFAVSDTGIGVPEDRLERIFERFEQAGPGTAKRYGGTGLGLAICKSLVEGMGGEIGVHSVVGMGTTFHFTVPLARGVEPGLPAQAPQAGAGEGREGANVLLVEDSEAIQLLVNYYLKDTPHSFEVAHDGEKGLERFASGSYDIVFMDIEMPIMDGFEACARMRALERERGRAPTSIYALTAHTQPGMEERCREAGFSGVVAKPFQREALLRLVRERAKGAPPGISS